jgi:hypothetical protein
MATIHSYTLQGNDVDLVRAVLRSEYKRILRESPAAFEEASPNSWVTRVADLCRELDCVPAHSCAVA